MMLLSSGCLGGNYSCCGDPSGLCESEISDRVSSKLDSVLAIRVASVWELLGYDQSTTSPVLFEAANPVKDVH